MSQKALCPLTDLCNGNIGSAVLDDGQRIAIYQVDGQVYATDDRCSHGDASLADEGSLDGHTVECGLHFGTFDVRTGAATSAPCVHAIKTYPVEVRDGQVWLSAIASAGEVT
jgi:nitrite reductase/ring-hydroxylating ferredoxin subunit